MARNKIRVLIVDDSPVDRELLIAMIGGEPDFEVAGQAADAYEAREKIRTLNPDVLTLDVEMPRMDGIKFLRNLMRLRPMPVVMCSAATEAGAAVTLSALEIGAVDFVAKPGTSGRSLDEYRRDLVEKVRTAAYARVRAYVGGEEQASAGATHSTTAVHANPLPATPAESAARRRPSADGSEEALARAAEAPPRRVLNRERAVVPDLIAIGASTGGVTAIEQVLRGLPAAGFPPIVVTQHIPPGFSRAFATRLDAALPFKVQEAEDGLAIQREQVYVAPGGRHFSIERQGDSYVCRVALAPPVNHHRPSVEVLFRSVAEHAGPRAIGVMLTGMGSDGAESMLRMREAGAYNLVQDEASSVVWGMPGAAAKLGAANEVLPLERIAAAVCQLTVEQGAAAARGRRRG